MWQYPCQVYSKTSALSLRKLIFDIPKSISFLFYSSLYSLLYYLPLLLWIAMQSVGDSMLRVWLTIIQL